MKLRLLITCLFTAFVAGNVFTTVNAQELKTIQEIQTPTSDSDDKPKLKGTTVKVVGLVATTPSLYYTVTTSSSKAYCFWIQEKGKSGPQTGLFVRLGDGNKADATGVKSLAIGQEVELVGEVDYYNGETQFKLSETLKVTVKGVGEKITDPVEIAASLLNDNKGVAVSTGEQYQGSYVRIKNLKVATVNGSADRAAFTVTDENGVLINVFDPNINNRLQKNGFENQKPKVGIVYESISGFISDNKFPGDNPRYVLNPFDTSDFKINAKTVPPSLDNIRRNPVCPKPTDKVKVTAQVNHGAGTPIKSVVLKYSIGASNIVYTSIPMTGSGADYSVDIPEQALGSFVHYYVEATDDNGNVTINPVFTPYAYSVSESGCNIADIQYISKPIQFNKATKAPSRSTWNESGYRDHVVTDVKAVVTASATGDNLGFCFIQDPAKKAWAGIMLVGDILDQLKVGDSIVVRSGTVREEFGLTQIADAKIDKIASVTAVPPLVLDLSAFNPDSQTINTEAYEAMFVRFEAQSGSNIYVTNALLDTANVYRAMDWLVGKDKQDPKSGVRVMTGGESQARCSKNVGYINMEKWRVSVNNGVPVRIIKDGDPFTSVQGIMTYDRDRMKILPRINTDIDGFVGIEELLPTTQFQLYPNPAADKFSLLTPVPVYSVEILNVLGQKIDVLTFEDNTSNIVEISTANLPSGTYFINAKKSNNSVLLKTKIVVIK